MSAQADHEGLTVEEVDVDGALREAAEDAGHTRATFVRRGALVGGGLLAGALPLALATGQSGISKNDRKILNFALLLEYLGAAFYAEANSQGALSGELATFSQVVAQHEAAHVAAVQGLLGSSARSKPEFDFKDTTSDRKKFARTAQMLEDNDVAALQGAAPSIESKAVLAAAGSFLPVEARQAAWIRDINGRGDSPSPARVAFSKPRSTAEVQSVLDATGFIS